MAYRDTSTLDKVGQFNLDKLEIISYRQDKSEAGPKLMDIRGITLNFEIAEDILSNNLVGSLIVYDAQDIKTLLPITGLEKLSFKMSTPGFDGYDCTSESGHPMQIYKVDKVKLDPKTGKQQLYKIFFCSEEMYYNTLNRVSQAFEGPIEDAVDKIFRTRTYLNSKKPLFFEPTKSNSKFVIPNLRPYKAIGMLSSMAKSAKYDNAGYLFYETSKGFQFRSLESMLAMGGASLRPPAWKFMTQIVPITDTKVEGVKNVKRRMSTVINYQFDRPVDTMINIMSGMLSNRLIVHDAFNKTLTTTDFNYKEKFAKSFHTDEGTDNFLSPDTPFGDTGKTLFEHPLSMLMTMTETSKIHNNYEFPKAAEILPLIVSQMQTMKNMNLNLEVYLNTNINAGDVIEFSNPVIQPKAPGEQEEENPYASGRFLVLAVKHIINIEAEQGSTIIKCFKDSVRTPLPSESDPLIVGTEEKEKADINEADLAIST